MNFREWAGRFPDAAAELMQVIDASTPAGKAEGKTEAWSQQRARLEAARQGALAWRNNVGATPHMERHSCPRCAFHFEIKKQPVRYGLANESQQLNARMKSSDLILAIPRVIRPEHVGHTIAQFGSVETKRPGWKYSGSDHEAGQAAWLSLVASVGGFACFSTGEVKL